MKYILCIFLFSLLLSACDNSDELTPRIEDVIDTSIVIPTSRLTYEEQDALEVERQFSTKPWQIGRMKNNCEFIKQKVMRKILFILIVISCWVGMAGCSDDDNKGGCFF
ncbi:MAG: hypothetical protein ACLU4J_15770 [Butyricimonas paravirosa]